MKSKLPLLLCLAAALGCGGPPAPPRYQIVSAGEDKAFRLDTQTGEVVYLVATHGTPVELPKEK